LPEWDSTSSQLQVLAKRKSSNNTIHTYIHNLDLSNNDIPVTNQNFYCYQNFKEQIEDEFNRTLNEFEHTEPFNRPLLPKQQSSKKLFAMIEILNQFILPDRGCLNVHEKNMEKHFEIKKSIIAKMTVQCKQRYTRTSLSYLAVLPLWI
jgi:uncharacterized protein YllA (UPF0747 family)